MIRVNIQDKRLCYFFFGKDKLNLLAKQLHKINCSNKDISNAAKMMQSKNCGFTFTNLKYRTSVVGISKTTSLGQWFNTLVHELKHVQSHICEYYKISERGEQAAYLIGYLMQQIIKKLN